MMNEKQQIEEMARVIDEYTEPLSARDIHKADFSEKFAEALYTAGYRKQEWISVEDRLPEENGRYLVFIKVSFFEDITIQRILEYNKSQGFNVYSVAETVTHWLPLPEAPKMKGDSDDT